MKFSFKLTIHSSIIVCTDICMCDRTFEKFLPVATTAKKYIHYNLRNLQFAH